jgi:hypothetical protein
VTAGARKLGALLGEPEVKGRFLSALTAAGRGPPVNHLVFWCLNKAMLGTASLLGRAAASRITELAARIPALTRDPLHPMQVPHQAAPRPDRTSMDLPSGSEFSRFVVSVHANFFAVPTRFCLKLFTSSQQRSSEWFPDGRTLILLRGRGRPCRISSIAGQPFYDSASTSQRQPGTQCRAREHLCSVRSQRHWFSDGNRSHPGSRRARSRQEGRGSVGECWVENQTQCIQQVTFFPLGFPRPLPRCP